jgi:hypothetical protein
MMVSLPPSPLNMTHAPHTDLPSRRVEAVSAKRFGKRVWDFLLSVFLSARLLRSLPGLQTERAVKKLSRLIALRSRESQSRVMRSYRF